MARKLTEVEVVTLIFSLVAMLSTLARLFLRRQRLWVDDFWALFSLLALIVQTAAVFTHTHSQMSGVIRYYLISTGFYAIIWSARLSLLFSIIRIDPYQKRRRWLYFVALIYAIVCILLIWQLLWICQKEPKWKTQPIPQCHLTVPIGVFQVITDVIVDGSLLITPMMLFRALVDRRLRRRLMGIFSTCIITTVVSLVHATYLLTSRGLPVVITGITENCVSLVVCNIPVIAVAVIRRREESLRQRQMTGFFSTIVFHPRDQMITFDEAAPLRR